jgi:hypothetical protein
MKVLNNALAKNAEKHSPMAWFEALDRNLPGSMEEDHE